jgi:hypothetical protein
MYHPGLEILDVGLTENLTIREDLPTAEDPMITNLKK